MECLLKMRSTHNGTMSQRNGCCNNLALFSVEWLDLGLVLSTMVKQSYEVQRLCWSPDYSNLVRLFIWWVQNLDNLTFRNVYPTNLIACSQRVIIAVLCGPSIKIFSKPNSFFCVCPLKLVSFYEWCEV